MRLISKSAFLRDAITRGIVLDDRYTPPQTLVFKDNSELGCSWQMPSNIKNLPRWITGLVDATRPDTKTYLYPRHGAWGSGNSLKIFQMAAIFSSCGLGPIGDEVIEAGESDRDAVESLLFLTLVFGGTVSDDVFLVPDHGKLVLFADHHQAVHADFRDREFMNRYLAAIPEYE